MPWDTPSITHKTLFLTSIISITAVLGFSAQEAFASPLFAISALDPTIVEDIGTTVVTVSLSQASLDPVVVVGNADTEKI